MLNLIRMLEKLKDGEYTCGTRYSQLLEDIINYYTKSKQIIDFNSDNWIREYLRFNNLYNSEEEFEFIMKDIFTEYPQPVEKGFLIILKQELIKYLYNDDNMVNNANVKILNSLGFKCYPVTYNDKGCILGVITSYGTIVLNPFNKKGDVANG